MARLNHLANKAEQKDMFGVALRAEELRGKVAGYYIDRQIIKNNRILEDMTEEELNEHMKTIIEKIMDIFLTLKKRTKGVKWKKKKINLNV